MSVKTTVLFNNLSTNEKGYIKDLLQDYLVNPLVSKQTLSEEIKNNTSLKIDRKGVTKIMDHLGMPDRSIEVIRASKAGLGKQKVRLSAEEDFQHLVNKILEKYSLEEFEELYNSSSITKMSEVLSISPYYVRMLLDHFDISVREIAPTYKEIVIALDKKGIRLKEIEQYYLNRDHSFDDFLAYLSNNVNYKVSNTSAYRLLKYLNIVKPQDLIAYHQGKKSRKELLENLEKLKKSGFDTREELAKYYEDNKSLTKRTLVKDLNKTLGENFFTESWLANHLDPFLSEDRLKGVSRVEKEFQEMLSLVVPSDVDIVLNDWKTIAPYQLDVLIPELNLAIEFNGNYWHSDKFLMKNHNMTSEEYHTLKKLMCKEKGINLLFVWEYDWYEDSDVILQELEKVLQGKKPSSILTKKQY